MCYTLVKVLSQCKWKHPIDFKICWRHCDAASRVANQTRKWNCRCADQGCKPDSYISLRETTKTDIAHDCRICGSIKVASKPVHGEREGAWSQITNEVLRLEELITEKKNRLAQLEVQKREYAHQPLFLGRLDQTIRDEKYQQSVIQSQLDVENDRFDTEDGNWVDTVKYLFGEAVQPYIDFFNPQAKHRSIFWYGQVTTEERTKAANIGQAAPSCLPPNELLRAKEAMSSKVIDWDVAQ